MSRLNLVARIDSSFPDKTAYKRVLDTGGNRLGEQQRP